MNIEKHEKRFGGGLFAFIIGCLLVFQSVNALQVSASETGIAANILLSLMQDTTLMEEASETSNPVGTLQAGTPVISLEAAADNWVKVMYQDLSGYVPVSAVRIQDTAALDAEFEEISNEYRLVFEVIEYQNTQKKQNLMWGGVIVVLVAAVFMAGIVSVIDSNRRKAAQHKKKHKGQKRNF